MKKLSYLFYLIFIMNLSYAQVYKNKGPAFISNGKIAGGFNQKSIAVLYAAWNYKHIDYNFLNKQSIKSKFRKLSDKDVSSIQLKPNDYNTNALSFGYRNKYGEYTPWDFAGVEYGYCHGMTLVLRQFLYFAEFKSEEKIPANIAKSESSLKKYFEDKIDDVMNNKPTVFPGFKDLTDFSKSASKEYLMRHSVDQWGINSAKVSLYGQFKNWKELTVDRLLKLTNDLDNYLKKGFYPRLVIGDPMFTNENPHVVMITKYHLEKTENEFEYCLRLSYLDVGYEDGSTPVNDETCIGVGSYVIMPSDEEVYFQNTVLGMREDIR